MEKIAIATAAIIFIIAGVIYPTQSEYILTTLRDTVRGAGAENVKVEFFEPDEGDEWKLIGKDITYGTFGGASASYGNNGRKQIIGNATENIEPQKVPILKVVLHTEEYYKNQNLSSFYPYIEIIVEKQEYNMMVPILMSPYGYSAYLGH